jgi:mannose-6-phosphate isomerase
MDIYNQPWKLVPNKIRSPGGREIDKFRGTSPAVDTPDGSEAWIGSVTRVAYPHPDKPHWGCSEVILPDGRRMYLFEAITLDPEKVLGKNHVVLHGTNLGMLIKFLDAKEQYLLQCHPTREMAKKMWNSNFGKEESWYVIGTRDDTPEPAYVILGFKEGITREKFEELYRKEDIQSLENLCHKIPVQTGDVFFLGGGLVHALGQGCFVIEVQEPSDITAVPVTNEKRAKMQKREILEDNASYDRKMLGSFIYEGCSYEENLRRWKIPHKTIREGTWGKEYILVGPDQTTYFSFTLMDVKGNTEVPGTGFPRVAIVLEGSGKFTFIDGVMELRKGDEIFLPWNIQGLRLEGDISVIFCNPEGSKYE